MFATVSKTFAPLRMLSKIDKKGYFLSMKNKSKTKIMIPIVS